MILSGAYLGFMLDKLVRDRVDTGDLKALVPDRKHYELGVASIVHSHGKANRARELFIDCVQGLHRRTSATALADLPKPPI